MTVWTFYTERRNWWCKSGIFFSARLYWRDCHHDQRRSTFLHSVFWKLWLRLAQGNLHVHTFCCLLAFPNITNTCRCLLVTRQGELCSTKFSFWVNLVVQHPALQFFCTYSLRKVTILCFFFILFKVANWSLIFNEDSDYSVLCYLQVLWIIFYNNIAGFLLFLSFP